jgi:hypothetical protein
MPGCHYERVGQRDGGDQGFHSRTLEGPGLCGTTFVPRLSRVGTVYR